LSIRQPPDHVRLQQRQRREHRSAMSSHQNLSSQPKVGRLRSLSNRIAGCDPKTMQLTMRIFNMANAVFLAGAGVAMFTGSSLSVLGCLAGIYVIFFSASLFFFEFRLEALNHIFLENMGFMFNWRGRACFFLFIGTLAFGLGPVGIAAGCYTILNLLWNSFALSMNPAYFEMQKAESAEMKSKAFSDANAMKHVDAKTAMAVAGAAHGALSSAKDVQLNMSNGAGEDDDVLPAGWAKHTDEETGDVYYHNAALDKTTWTRPT